MGKLNCLKLVILALITVVPSGVFGQTGEVRVLSTAGLTGQRVLVSVEMVATGKENAIGFSLNFEPRVLANPIVSIGSGANGAVLNVNTNSVIDGQIGVVIALAANQTLPAGVLQLLTVSFEIPSDASFRESQISFGDLPVVREVVDSTAVRLQTVFTPGTLKTVPYLQPPQILITPSSPNVDDEVVVDVAGVWNDGCVPGRPVLTRDGSRLTLRVFRQGEICLQALQPYRITSKIGTLASGNYTLVLVHDSVPAVGGPLQLGSASFYVNPRLTNSNAASYGAGRVAPQSIVALFGVDLATTTLSATAGMPLPTSLGGTIVRVKDAGGSERPAPLFFVSSRQINYQVPMGTISGMATVTITNGDGRVAVGSVNIAPLAPGVFTANGTGRGQISGYVERHKGPGLVSIEPIWRTDSAGGLVSESVDLGAANEQVFLVFYGTGFRARSSLSGVRVNIGGLPHEVVFAGEVERINAGVDQCNVRLDRRLIGRGVVEIELIVDGVVANTTTVSIK